MVTTAAQEPRHSLTQAEKEHITLTVETYDAEELDFIFPPDVSKKRVEPFLLQIDNRSGQAYAFQKTDVEGYLPASQVAQDARVDLPTTAVRNTQWFVVSAPVDAVGWAVRSILRARMQSFGKVTQNKPRNNWDLQTDLARREIADGIVVPQSSRVGYVFIRPPKPGSPIKVKLTNIQTQAPLLFEISPTYSSAGK